MPFEQITPRMFTAEAVRTYAPPDAGVFAVTNSRQWLYIGHAGNTQRALLDLMEDCGSALMKKDPRGFVFEVCGRERSITRQDRLVLEYEPVCNRHGSGPNGKEAHRGVA